MQNRLKYDNYERPKNTLTEAMQEKDVINEKIENYVKVTPENIDYLPKGIHIRYFIWNKKGKKGDKNKEFELPDGTKINLGEYLFRTGGFLKVSKKDYIVLSGKDNKSFSVQKEIDGNPTLFYKKITKNDKLKEMQEIVARQQEFIEKFCKDKKSDKKN